MGPSYIQRLLTVAALKVGCTLYTTSTNQTSPSTQPPTSLTPNDYTLIAKCHLQIHESRNTVNEPQTPSLFAPFESSLSIINPCSTVEHHQHCLGTSPPWKFKAELFLTPCKLCAPHYDHYRSKSTNSHIHFMPKPTQELYSLKSFYKSFYY